MRPVRAKEVVAAAALVLAAAAPVHGARRPSEAAPSLQEVGNAFEQNRLLSEADRLPALQQNQQSVAQVVRGGLDADRRAAARFLSGAVEYELGNYAQASQAYTEAVGDGKGPFADDAAFAAIEALEAAGRDADAAREWARWEKRFPTSPLIPAARLGQAWNAMRRGDVPAANKLLATATAGAPWMEKNPRLILARAVALHLSGKSDEALVLLGPKPTGAVATYLKALCLDASGSRLKAAAAFQDVAERYPDSPLRDHALLGKANAFLAARDYRSAGEEFTRVASKVKDPVVKAEAELRAAGSVFLTGAVDSSLGLLRGIAESHPGTDVAARAQFLVGEALVAQGKPAEAIVEFNRVLSQYFQHKVAASAQYRVARSLDALGRRADATGSYQAVVAGYPLEPEAPAAAYLAGVGLMDQKKPIAAAPYFQLVLDRYAGTKDQAGHVVFAKPEHQELVEAALCLLELCYHRAGDLGQLSGAPHLLLEQMPTSRSPWRAYALLIDADASAAMGRYPLAQQTLETLMKEFPDHAVGASATKLLAWTYARQGQDSLAIATEERLLARWGARGDAQIISAAVLDIAHERFNQKRYRDAAAAYEDFLKRFPGHPKRLLALYQAGLAYLRIDRAGDAVDRWETIMRDSATSPLAERAWARAGDVYFQAERYTEAKRAYKGLLQHFAGSSAASLAMLRLAQCEYNAGHDADALAGYAAVSDRFPGTPAAKEAAHGTERALYRLSQTAGGSQTLEKLVEQYPNSPFAADARFQIAKRLYGEKKYAEAAEQFRRVVSQFPGYSAADHAQFLLADSYALAKANDDAKLAYEQFLSFFPNSELAPTVYFRLGLMRFEAKDYAQAAISFTRVLEDSAAPDVRAASRYNLALCNRLIGQTDEARVALEQYRKDFPNDSRAAEVAFQLGDLDEAAGNVDEAVKEFKTALDHKPSMSLGIEIYYRVGRLYEQKGEITAALRAYESAMAAPDRDHPYRLSAVARSAALYEAKKDFPRALAAYRDIMRNAKDPELVAAAEDRATALSRGR
jgi:TolA-binding protein